MTQTQLDAEATKANSISLDARGISKSYPGVRALHEVDFQVLAGEVHGVVGENGAGKSTLMGIVSGAVEPNSGTVSIDGKTLAPFNPSAAKAYGLAIVRQEPALLPDLTVAENLYLGTPENARPKISAMGPWASEVLALWSSDLQLNPETRVEQLLPEQRFIVEICRAVSAKPKILILDEPTEHLAGEDVERLFRHIRSLSQEGTAVIYISHRISEVKRIADRITVLRNGEAKGTRDAHALTESDIVNLIVGRVLEATFPPKSSDFDPNDSRLAVSGFTGSRFQNIDLSVAAGEIVGIAGIEGNGQREFLRALVGLGRHRDGHMTVDGVGISTRSPADAAEFGLTYIAADRHREGVFAGLSVRENIAARSLASLAKFGFVSSSQELRTVDVLARDFRVKTPTLDTDIASLSGGNQQKAILAGAFATEPKVLLLDEPTQGVDVGARSEIYTLIRDRAADTGMATIVLSSDAMELSGFCDRVVVFSRGHIVNELVGTEVREERITESALQATSTREKPRREGNSLLSWLAGDWAPAGLVALALAMLTIVAQTNNGLFLSPLSIASLLTLATTLVFATLAQNLVLLVGGIDLSVGPLMGFLVVVLSFFLVDGTSAGMQVLGWLLLLVIPVFVGFANWALSDIAKMHPMIATLVTYMALQALSLMLRPVPGGYISRGITEPLSTKLGPVPVVFILAVAVSVGLGWWLIKSRAGISLRAVGSAPVVAQMNGLRPRRVRLAAYVGASLLSAVGAVILMAQLGSGDPTAGMSYTLASISAAVVGGASLLGGRGNFVGALLGAMLIQLAMSVTIFMGIDSAWQSFLLGGLTIAAVAGYSMSRQRVAVEAH